MKILKQLTLSALLCIGMSLSASANDGYDGYAGGHDGGYASGSCGGGCGFGGGLFRGLSYNCNRAPSYEYGAALWDNYCDHQPDYNGGGGCGLFGGGCGLFNRGGGGIGGGSCFGYPGQNCCDDCGSGGGGFGRAGGGCGFGGGLIARLGNGGCGSGCGGGIFAGLFSRGSGCGGGNHGGGCFDYPAQDCGGCGGYGVSYNDCGCGVGGRHGISVFGFQRRAYSQYNSCGSNYGCGCGNSGCDGGCGASNSGYSSPQVINQPTPAQPNQNSFNSNIESAPGQTIQPSVDVIENNDAGTLDDSLNLDDGSDRR